MDIAAREARERAEAESPKEPKAQFLDHYLYFPKKSQAARASERLQAKGWTVEVRKGVDGKNWLALARQPAPIEDDNEGRSGRTGGSSGRAGRRIRRLGRIGMKRGKAKIGDIVEIKTPAGLAYVQYTHDERDELVRVLPGLYAERPDIRRLAQAEELYFVFYTLSDALRDRQAQVVINTPVPERVRPFPILRHVGASDHSGKPLNWLIGDGATGVTLDNILDLLRVTELSPDQRKLSVEQLWSHPAMVKELARGWTPERAEEFRLMDVAAAEAELLLQPKSQPPDHYLYFPKKSQAVRAGEGLRAKGWTVEVREEADGENWLALGKYPAPIEDYVEDVREGLEQLEAELGRRVPPLERIGMKRRKAKIGDIAEISTAAGLAYVQYTHDGGDMGELVRVLPGLYASRPDVKKLAQEKELYFIFYILNYALRDRETAIISNEPVPEWARRFPVMRKRAGDHGWLIGDSSKQSTFEDIRRLSYVEWLTPEQMKLSIGGGALSASGASEAASKGMDSRA